MSIDMNRVSDIGRKLRVGKQHYSSELLEYDRLLTQVNKLRHSLDLLAKKRAIRIVTSGENLASGEIEEADPEYGLVHDVLVDLLQRKLDRFLTQIGKRFENV